METIVKTSLSEIRLLIAEAYQTGWDHRGNWGDNKPTIAETNETREAYVNQAIGKVK